jgi:tetratricopeptide (TPR) repeat protein
MKRMYVLLLCLSLVTLASASQQHGAKAANPKTATGVMKGFGPQHHPISTKNPEVQKLFDQGLNLIYGFNHDEAERSFRKALRLDPNCAMCHWGIAYAVGPNYNLPVDAAREKIAFDETQKALAAAKNAPAQERAYINALVPRYTDAKDPDYHQLSVNFRNAMRELHKQYPDDLDAATLYAESMMNLRPWALWNADGTPAEDTLEIVSVLESVLKRSPEHIGAIHYYIHTTEASNSPERAMPGAKILGALAPASGHLVHMPAHVYIRTGDYDAARRVNIDASQADEAYIRATKVEGIYPMMYYSHNVHFVAISAAMQGRAAESITSAEKLAKHVAPHVDAMPMLEGFSVLPTLMRTRFSRWNEILKRPRPSEKRQLERAMDHYARGIALARTGRIAEAEMEAKDLNKATQGYPPDTALGQNKTIDILRLADMVLAANISAAKKDTPAAMEMIRKAVAHEDTLKYNEPPDWFYPVRETLGAWLLKQGEAAEAEQVFRKDLEKNARNPRSLLGLREALKLQQKDYEAALIDMRFQHEWKMADTKPNLNEF